MSFKITSTSIIDFEKFSLKKNIGHTVCHSYWNDMLLYLFNNVQLRVITAFSIVG